MNNFADRVFSLFSNPLEQIPFCSKQVYLSTVSELIDRIDNYDELKNICMCINLGPIDIKYLCWKHLEEADIFVPDFVNSIEIKVGYREEILFCNLYLNEEYVGNLYFNYPLTNYIVIMRKESDETCASCLTNQADNRFITAIYTIIKLSFMLILNQPSNMEVYSALDPIFIMIS